MTGSIALVYDERGRASVHAGALGVEMSRTVYVNGAYVPEEEATITSSTAASSSPTGSTR